MQDCEYFCNHTQRLADSPKVVTLRDSTTVEELMAQLPKARRIVIVGNGGIALELVHALHGIEVSRAKHCSPSCFI